jgi:sigma-B regulation protein RsbU (phosphoserine phosphatase)
MTKYNAYNTTDPVQLLALKRQESRVLLDVIRSINPETPPAELIANVVHAIRNQLDVSKLIFVTQFGGKKKIEVNVNFPPVTLEALDFLDNVTSTTRVKRKIPEAVRELGAEFIIPVGMKNRPPTGWFIIAEFAESAEEALNDLIFIETVGNILALSLENKLLLEEQLKRRALEQELEFASRIQRLALPSSFAFPEFIDVHAVNEAHSTVAGDFYDLIPVNSEEFYFCMADVAGKGIGAALLVANLQANFRALATARTSFHHILHHLNNAIMRLTESGQFVTMFLGKVNVRSRRMAYVNAGHNPPLFLRDGVVKELSKGVIPLGIMPLENLDLGAENCDPGSVIFLYTDGVVDQHNRSDEAVGLEPFAKMLVEKQGASSREIVDTALHLIRDHSGGIPRFDDLSIMTIRFL